MLKKMNVCFLGEVEGLMVESDEKIGRTIILYLLIKVKITVANSRLDSDRFKA